MKMMAFPKEAGCENLWETLIVKPAGVLPKDSNGLLTCVMGSDLSIRVDELAASMIDTVLNGSMEQVQSNREMVTKGRKLLKA
jgi:hypothetical protein